MEWKDKVAQNHLLEKEQMENNTEIWHVNPLVTKNEITLPNTYPRATSILFSM